MVEIFYFSKNNGINIKKNRTRADSEIWKKFPIDL